MLQRLLQKYLSLIQVNRQAMIRPSKLFFTITLLALLLSSGDLIAAKVSKTEELLRYQSDKADNYFHKAGFVYENKMLQEYLQGIMDRLFPEYIGEINVFIHRAPILNAFALLVQAIKKLFRTSR